MASHGAGTGLWAWSKVEGSTGGASLRDVFELGIEAMEKVEAEKGVDMMWVVAISMEAKETGYKGGGPPTHALLGSSGELDL